MDENIKYALEVVAKDPMATFLGIRVEEVRAAYARLSLHVGPQYLNSLRMGHGAAITAIIDQAVAVAANATEYEALVVELKINFLDPVAPDETLTAEASPLDIKRKLSLWEVEVRDGSGKRVALAHALAYHRQKKTGHGSTSS